MKILFYMQVLTMSFFSDFAIANPSNRCADEISTFQASIIGVDSESSASELIDCLNRLHPQPVRSPTVTIPFSPDCKQSSAGLPLLLPEPQQNPWWQVQPDVEAFAALCSPSSGTLFGMLPGTKSILVGKKNANEYVIKLLDPETMKKVLEESEVVHSQMNDPAIKFVPSVPSINTELPTGFESFMIVAPESNK